MSTGNLMGDAGGFTGAAAEPEAKLRYDLRPLSTGEVLDRTFQIYRSRFTLFAGLALLPATVSTVLNAARLVMVGPQVGHLTPRAEIISGVMSMLTGLILIVLYGITEAATIWAMSAIYLGEAASVKQAYKVAFKHWFRYTLVKLRQVWAAAWLPLLLFSAAGAAAAIFARHRFFGLTAILVVLFVLAGLSIIYSVWAYLRVSLAVPAAVVESLKVGASMRRSKHLLASRKFRILLLFLLLIALYIVVGMIESPLLILAVRSRGAEAIVTQAIQLGVNFVVGTLVAPVAAIGLCLFYFDERVRREGFDIEWMMGKLNPANEELPGAAPESSAEPA